MADTQDIIESTFREAIVKLVVSSAQPVYKDGVNLCESEGTGFLIGSNHVVTAEHVFILPKECGSPIIIVRSQSQSVERLAKVVGAKDDVAVLGMDEALPPTMCSLGLMGSDVFDTKGIRYGIPGKLRDAAIFPVRLGPKKNEFDPLVVLTPTTAEAGESGGPIIYNFNVVGILRSKHKEYKAFSFMTTVSAIRTLLSQLNLKPAGKICNPVEINMVVGLGSSATYNIVFNQRSAESSRQEAATALAAKLSSVPSPDVFNSLSLPKISHSGGAVTLDVPPTVGFFPPSLDSVSTKLKEELWREYVAQREAKGWWKR
ncbi:serine protease [Bradyrhizobium japonicum]|uniref:serine protease n=1 Tax=Bradyrhizobium japonicum TaxID=375 RepID=UPI000486E0ED|nr:serine protease [Bradyrhizobium japonicum]MCP1738218.1 hypothetical protein [Bradyrhizobium japonicum]MCP1856002.1 hypothetical protein [Bradyrhizobium japonicum]MCP1897183.1 hypothetical protein [Bradyrhizobium japonicum]MCW2330769.1 hypothetical protein [Bradyrhizobium japonicum]WLB96017.1 serine protease [Bradyrhizobium japonicum USDA 123]